jgi:hypothetical protein
MSTYDEALGKKLYAKLIKAATDEMERAGGVADLPRAKRHVEMGVLDALQYHVIEWFDMGLIDAAKGDEWLDMIEAKINTVLIEELTRPDHSGRCTHQLRRGKKTRGG